LKTCDAEELAALARSRGLLYMVNLLQRYNPLYETVKMIVDENILGGFLHGYFENYASDENLDENHWFWDESKSGGIFIEHGVHFFDMFCGWLGNGKVACALQLERPGINKKIFDRVQATVLFKEGIVNFYHGFDQPAILDRQEMRLQFERGEITLHGWIPIKMRLHGLLQKGQLNRLQEITGKISVVHHHKPGEKSQKAKGRFRELPFEDHITMEYEDTRGKQELYRQMLTAMISDQWAWIKDRKHIRVIDDRNAVESLRMAEDAWLALQNHQILNPKI
jgi:predicted dehydrogenase